MKRTLRSLAALLTATLLYGSVFAQAQTTNAIVTVPGAQPMVMPLNIYTLPYGTVTIAQGVYYIPNYEGTGISIYIQSPTALHVATLEEMVRYQAEWARVTQLITQAPSSAAPTSAQKAAPPVMPVNSAALALPAPAPLVQAAPQVVPAPATYAASAPVQAQPAPAVARPARTAAPAVSAAQVFNVPAQTYMAPPAAQPVFAVQAQPAFPAQVPAPVAAPQAMPTSAQVFGTPAQMTMPVSPAQAFNPPTQMPMPTSAQAFNTPAQMTMPVSSAQVFNMPPVAFTPQAPAPVAQVPAAAPWNTAVTLIPSYLHVNFRGRGNTVTYSISNASDTSSVQIDPNSLRAYQNGQPISAQLTVRDSSSGAATGTLMPRAMLVGTVKISTLALDPVTLTWQARDTTGRTYPISYAWMPQ